jgi:hypothetical protein
VPVYTCGSVSLMLKPVLEAQGFGFQRLTPKYNEPPSNCAFIFSLRRYTAGLFRVFTAPDVLVGRCRLTPINPR